MDLKINAAKNVTAIWLGLLVNLAVNFFLSPFILHKLGDEAFGLWILIFSLAGYYGLLDFGIRSSMVRYVAKFAATGDQDQMARFLNTSLATYSLVALLVLLATGIGSPYLGILFRIPAGLAAPARGLFLLVGGGVALTFPLSVFSGVLGGLQKFFWQHLIGAGFALVRALLIVIALTRGGGLLAIGFVTVALNLLSQVVFVGMAFRALHPRLGMRFVDPRAWRQLMGYGSAAWLILLAEKLRFQTDEGVIGVFLSSTAITYFSIGANLVEFPAAVVQGLAQVFTPMFGQFDATGDLDRVRKVLVVGNRASAMTIFPLCAVLIILGKPIIEVWVGAKYLSSYSVLLLLALPRTLYLAQAGSTRFLLGVGKHRALAWVLLLEGGANLALSVLLLRRWGITGVALGTAIPLTLTSLCFLPNHVCRLLEIPLATYLRQAYLIPLGLCAPLAVALLLLRRLFQPRGYAGLFFEVGLGGLVYGVGLLWFVLATEPIGASMRRRWAELRSPWGGPPGQA